MKKITIILFFISITCFAQNQENRKERIKNLKIAFISNKLDLTSQEAERFWPIYNKFDDQKVKLHIQKRQLMKKLKSENKMNLSDSESFKLMEESEKIELDILNNRRELVKNLQGVIPSQKVLLLKKIEDDFKNLLLKQLKNREKFKDVE